MNLESHISSLSARHTNLESQIEMEEQRPIPNSIRITELKKEKLRIKDEIQRLSLPH